MKRMFALLFLVFSTTILAFSQGKILASYKFSPNPNGYSFENFGNENRKWKDDLGVEDMIKLFGVDAVCKVGNTPKNCVLKTAAKQWLKEELASLDNGHCDGMATTALRFMSNLPFKGKGFPTNFQANAKSPFDLILDQSIENYISYYAISQDFDEVYQPTEATKEKGPVSIVKTLVESMKSRKDSYTIGIYKTKRNGELYDGHSVTPIAVEEFPTNYRIHLYDNNYPDETKYLTVEKAGKQTWKYTTSVNPKEKPEVYTGNFNTKSFSITKTSWRDGGCFASPFASEDDENTCVPSKVENTQTENTPPEKSPTKPKVTLKDILQIFIKGNSSMLVTDDEGRRFGFDEKTNRFYKEIPNASMRNSKTDGKTNQPRFYVPYKLGQKPYKITLSSDEGEPESNVDVNISAPNFTIGFRGISVEKNKSSQMTFTPDGENLSFKSESSEQSPSIYYAIDTEEESYFTEIDGVSLDANTTFSADFDEENGKLNFKDNDVNDDDYDVDFKLITTEGVVKNYETNDLDSSGIDSFEMEFGDWNGENSMKFKIDDEGNGFDDDEEISQPDEDNGIEDDEIGATNY